MRISDVISGKASLAELAANHWGASPDRTKQLLNLFATEDYACMEYTSGGTFTGNGVSFFLTGYNTSLQLSGQADWHLIAPANGPLPGFAIFLDPDGPSGLAGSTSSLSGQAELYFEGIV